MITGTRRALLRRAPIAGCLRPPLRLAIICARVARRRVSRRSQAGGRVDGRPAACRTSLALLSVVATGCGRVCVKSSRSVVRRTLRFLDFARIAGVGIKYFRILLQWSQIRHWHWILYKAACFHSNWFLFLSKKTRKMSSSPWLSNSWAPIFILLEK